MTKQECVENHRKMWNWIADETLRRKKVVTKYDYFKMVAPNSMCPLMACWCCEYCQCKCENCPIDWGDGKKCYTDNSDYDMFTHFGEISHLLYPRVYLEAAKYARNIANLPERK